MDWEALVLRAGDGVSAWGRLVRNDRGTWFDRPLRAGLVRVHRGPIHAPARAAVPVEGADLAKVAGHYERDGAAEGWALLTGSWSGSALRVTRQSSHRPPPPPLPEWTKPPCPPPPGGWPHGMNGRYQDSLDYDLGDLAETGAAVSAVTFRPGPDQAVLVVAAADPETVESHLRPQLGLRLCVIPSLWARPQVDEVLAYVRARWEDWDVSGAGPQADEAGQVHVRVGLAQVLSEVAAWAATLPPGLLELDPWLAPLR